MESVKMDFEKGFNVIAGNEVSQAATMVIPPGGSTGSDTNRHPSSDQWLYVVSGKGEAVIEGETLDLAPRTLVLIEKGESHKIKNTGKKALETINFYVPPEF